MRPIDADALISEIRKDAEKAIEQDDRVGSFWLGYIAGLVIKQPTAQPELPWIPVSERLPEESGWHICTCHDGVSERVTFLKWQKRLKQWEKTGARSYWKVLAWMPLTEAYKPNNE